MGFFEDLFDPELMFDSDYRQRKDIRQLKADISAMDEGPRILRLERQVAQLQLLCNALVKVIERKELATRTELEVVVQQIDLMDGVEDGAMAEAAWTGAPRCEGCNHFVNPARGHCIYCNRPLATTESGPYRGGPGEARTPPPTAACSSCQQIVPLNMTVFTDGGRLCCVSCAHA